MTVSMRRMSAGEGYRYLLRSVAAGDGDRALSTPLTRYYTEVGTPPGRWMGYGLQALGNGRIRSGMRVSEEQLALLIGMGRDPVTGEQLGRAYPVYAPLAERIRERVEALDPEMTLEDCAAETARIEAEEAAVGGRHAVAGYDLTCSVPKSVSVLWGIADAAIQERIVEAHHAAVADVLDFFEREVAATRTGVSDGDGAVAQVEVAGVAAVAFDHYDSRAGDPQLHTHLVIANKVMTVLDGRWRSLDGRPVYAAVTGLSALYNALLADRIARDLGVAWEQRERAVDRNPQWEIVGVSDDLIGEFSSRSGDIEAEKDRLIEAYTAAHGRRPSEKTIVRLRAQATLATRPPKELRSLADLTAEWRQRASRRLGTDASSWAASLLNQPSRPPTRAEDVPLAAIRSIGAEVVGQVSSKRSTWSHWNLLAGAARQTMAMRFATTADREAVVGMVVDAATEHSIALTPPELAPSPAAFRRPDGTSVFRPRHATRFSSTSVLEAEARLLDLADTMTAPRVRVHTLGRVARGTRPRLSGEQATALEAVATSGRHVDVLVGPAGAGKTTTMRALRQAWMLEHGRGSVVGLAPSAAAAHTLATDLGVACENSAKWLYERDRGHPDYRLRAGQLVILDEAGLAGTTTLDRIAGAATAAGAKVLLVGDPHQLGSVEAGGAFSLLVDRRTEPPALTEIHRFTQPWEKDTSLRLRRGEADAIATYARHDRIREGATDQMLDAAYAAWRTDTDTERVSILVTESAEAVRALNQRARAERLLTEGPPPRHGAREVELADGLSASIGDTIITRRNDRTLRTTATGQDWVRNGDRWTITDVRGDGSVIVQRLGPRAATSVRGSAILPAHYVREHVDLGYAVTAHRAQGVTVDTAHVVVTASATRENLYVAMTRGREANVAYVALDQPDETHAPPEPQNVTARTVLYGVLKHVGAEISAHHAIELAQDECGSIARLAAELETIVTAAQRDRFVDLLRRSGLTAEQHAAAVGSTAFGPLAASLRRAEAYHHNLDRLVPRLVRQHRLDNANDIAAVLRRRVDQAAATTPRGLRRARPRLIAGLIPEPAGPLSQEERAAITERKHLIESRARALAEEAVMARASWVARLGEPPGMPAAREEWFATVTTVAAYRDRYRITSVLPIGGAAESQTQQTDRRRALVATRRALSIAGRSVPHPDRSVTAIEVEAVSRPVAATAYGL